MTPRGGGKARLRALLFDLDGTLIDSKELILASYRHTMRVHLGSVPPDAAWLATMGTPLVAQLRDFARSEREATAMLDTYRRHNARAHDGMVRRYQGVAETLEWLHGSGFPLGIVTSKLREGALRGLRACGLRREWFRAVVTASDPVAHKPDPAPVLLALEQLGEPPGRSLFVGDSVWDIRAGRAAGTATAAALWGPFGRSELEAEGPDYVLQRIEDLRRIVGEEPPGRGP